MAWSTLSLVSDDEIGALEPEATHASAPWGATTWSAARTEAKRDLRIWLEADYASVPAVADRILDRWAADWVFGFTGSAYTDLTVAARNDTEEDLDLASVFTTALTDRIYIGAAYAFDGVVVKLLDSVNAVASVLTAKYWGANQWQSLSASDGTAVAGKTCAQSGRITWTQPSTWERRTLNGTGDEYYWVELSVSAALTSGTTATQLLPIRAPDGLKRIAAWLALSHILNGLAIQAPTRDWWKQRAEDYYAKAHALYQTLKAHGGIPIDVSHDQAIQPAEALITQPVILGRA